MKLNDFDYNLPKELIANSHAEPRDHSRLFVFDRKSDKIEHKHFYDIINFLGEDCLLVFNDSKVFKARIYGKKETGGEIELLLIRPLDDFVWEALIRGKVSIGDKIFFKDDVNSEILDKKEMIYQVKFCVPTKETFEYLEKEGETPLPPYITIENEKSRLENKEFYQNVYANKVGSVAAPTAGFHFTEDLLGKIKDKGIEILNVTLHVGPGTFLPVKSENVLEHKMHEEFFEVKKDIWNKLINAKKSGKKIVVVGTTTCRTLESIANMIGLEKTEKDIFGSTDIFIYPPYDFKIVDSLITNFHLPKSTLLMLVAAFLEPDGLSGIDKIKELYSEAIDNKYRFYSFGDSMFLK